MCFFPLLSNCNEKYRAWGIRNAPLPPKEKKELVPNAQNDVCAFLVLQKNVLDRSFWFFLNWIVAGVSSPVFVVQLDCAGAAVWHGFCSPYISTLAEPWNQTLCECVGLRNCSVCVEKEWFGHLICFCIWAYPNCVPFCLPTPHPGLSWFLFVPAKMLQGRATPQVTWKHKCLSWVWKL